MPTNTNTGWRGQAAATGGRFARSAAAQQSSGGRFGRGGTPNRAPNSAGRALAARNRAEVRRRRGAGKQPSGLGKLLGGLAGGSAAKRTAAKAGRKGVGAPAGLALLAGAAGLAMKNRDKLGSLLGRGGSSDHQEHGQITSVPTEPTVVAPASHDTDTTVDPATRPGSMG